MAFMICGAPPWELFSRENKRQIAGGQRGRRATQSAGWQRRWLAPRAARLRQRAQEAAMAPLAGRIVPELGRDDVREVFVRTHRVVCRVRAGPVEVLTVFEGHLRLVRDTETPAGD